MSKILKHIRKAGEFVMTVETVSLSNGTIVDMILLSTGQLVTVDSEYLIVWENPEGFQNPTEDNATVIMSLSLKDNEASIG